MAECPKCKSTRIDDGTPHGSTYDFVCRNCGHKFDMPNTDEPDEMPVALGQQKYIDEFYDEYNEFPSEQQLIEWREANDYLHEGDEYETDDEVEARLDQLDDEEREE